jgi:hypothetical protein
LDFLFELLDSAPGITIQPLTAIATLVKAYRESKVVGSPGKAIFGQVAQPQVKMSSRFKCGRPSSRMNTLEEH